MNNAHDLRILVVIGILVMFLLFVSFMAAVFFNQRKKLKYQQSMQQLREEQQNQLIEAAIRSEELERHRIAETLHDEVGAILSSAKLHLLGIKIAGLGEKDLQMHQKGGELLNEVIRKVRGISHNLHSNILKEFGLNEAIRDFVKKIATGGSLQVETALDEDYRSPGEEADIGLYRVIQELINNIIKHAHANRMDIRTVQENGQLQLTLFHNGKGLSQSEFEALRYRKAGLGLKNIQNRIILLKGSIRFSQDTDGYRVLLQVPTKKETT